MGSRRKFLYQSGIILSSLALPTKSFGFENFPQRKNSKSLILDILNDDKNFSGYYGYNTSSDKKYLERKGIEYIVNSSKKIFDSTPLVAEGEIVLDLNYELFKKIYNPKPEFSLPVVSKTLNKFHQADDFVEISATIKKNYKKQALWYHASNGPKGNHMAIPYFDDGKSLIYAEGEKWGVKGNVLNLIQYYPVGNKTKIKTNSFLKLDGTNIIGDIAISLLSGTIAEKTVNELKNSQKDVEIFMKILNKNTFSGMKNEYGFNERNWLEKLVKLEEELK